MTLSKTAPKNDSSPAFPSWRHGRAPAWQDNLRGLNVQVSLSSAALLWQWARTALVQTAVQHTPRVSSGLAEWEWSLYVRDLPGLLRALEASGGRRLVTSGAEPHETQTSNAPWSAVYGGDHAMLGLNVGALGFVEFTLLALDAELAEFLAAITRAFGDAAQTEPPVEPAARPVFMFAGGELGFFPIGAVKTPLCRANYPPDVLADYDVVCQNLRREHPAGRLALLSGPTGTGKTHLLYGLIHDCPDAIFVLASPAMIPQITEPHMLPRILELQHRFGTTLPIVFLIEDGDRAVAERQVENLDYIQSLLAIGAGLPGDFLNLHVILTTNAGTRSTRLTLDEAILRRRRLVRHLHVGPCDRDLTRAIFARLCPDVALPDTLQARETCTLADLYDVAAQHGWTEPVAPTPPCRRVLLQGQPLRVTRMR